MNLADIQTLAEEISAIISEGQFTASQVVLETNHKIGEAIVAHPAYKKGQHGNGELVKRLAVLLNKSEQHLYFCIKFADKYPEVSNALETLQPDKKNLAWRDVVQSFSETEKTGKEFEGCKHPDTYEVKYRCCRGCGARIVDKSKIGKDMK